MATKKASGSQKMNASRTGAGKAAAGTGELDKIVASLGRRGIEHKIIIRGIPIPDIIKGTLTAKNPRQLNSALEAFMNARGIEYKPVRLFPKGMPQIREIVAEIEGKLKR